MRPIALVLVASSLSVAGEPYRVVSQESRFEVEVGRAGLFKMFGHDHRIEVRGFTGRIEWDSAKPEASTFRLEVDALSLAVADEGLSPEDRATVQADMETKALAVSEHPRIVFQSTEVKREGSSGPARKLKVIGTLALRGVSETLEIPIEVSETEGRLRIVGTIELDSARWGVPQISALGGSVKTKEKLDLSFDLVAAR